MRRLAAAVVTVALLFGGGAGAQTPEARKRQVDQQIATLRAQVAEASAAEARLLDKLDAADARLAALSAEVATLDRRIVAAQAELAAAQADLDAAELRHREARAALVEVLGRLAAARDDLRARAVDAYTDGPLLAVYMSGILDVDDPGSAARRGYLDAVLAARRHTVERLADLRTLAAARASELESARAEALAQRDLVAERAAALQAARAGRDAARQQVAAETAAHTAVLDEIRRRKAEFQAEIAALRRESDAIAAMLRSRQAGQPRAGAATGILDWPIPGAPITSGYGPRRHPIFGDERMHTGVDFGASAGTPIRAAADGVVVVAGERGGYGLTVVIDHGDNLATLYAHQSGLAVGEGERVRRGQVIGAVGATGFATGPHLHFEVRVRGNPVDPVPWLRGGATGR